MPGSDVFLDEHLDRALAATPASRRCTCTRYSDAFCIGPGDHPGQLCHLCYLGCSQVILVCEGKVRYHSHVARPAWAAP